MSTNVHHRTLNNAFVEVKSKFDAEFRRFKIDLDGPGALPTFEEFKKFLEERHLLGGRRKGQDCGATTFHISYTDPKDNDLLPINNTDNYQRALHTARPVLRLVIQRQGELDETYYPGRRLYSNVTGSMSGIGGVGGGVGGVGSTSLLSSMLGAGAPMSGKSHKPMISISQPSEFRQVSSIIDVDVVPETCRRVRLLKHGSDKPLGFYIRDGTSVRVTHSSLEKVPGIFISRLLAGGLAESTGLLAVNDEVLEVNGIEVAGKSLDQVTDMMVANSSNLIVTVKPANQRTLMPSHPPRRGSFSRNSNVSSHGSLLSRGSSTHSHSDAAAPLGPDHDDEDEIRDLTAADGASLGGYSSIGLINSGNNGTTGRGHGHHHLPSSLTAGGSSGNKKHQVLHL